MRRKVLRALLLVMIAVGLSGCPVGGIEINPTPTPTPPAPPTPPTPPAPTYDAPTIQPIPGMRGWIEMTLPDDVDSGDITDFQGSVDGGADESLDNRGCTDNVCNLVFSGLMINDTYSVNANFYVDEDYSEDSNDETLDTSVTVTQYLSPAGTLRFAEKLAHGDMNADGYPDFIARGRTGTDTLLLMGGVDFPQTSATFVGLNGSFGEDFALADADGDGLDNPIIGQGFYAVTFDGNVYVYDEADQSGNIVVADSLFSLKDDVNSSECGNYFAALDNGSGSIDLVIGAAQWDGITNFGRVYQADGPFLMEVLLGLADAIDTGALAGDLAGWRVYNAGNVTGSTAGVETALYISERVGDHHAFALSGIGIFTTVTHDAGADSIAGGTVGDLDGDGRDEFVLSVWQPPIQKFYIFYDYQNPTRRYEVDYTDSTCGMGFAAGDYYGTGERVLMVTCQGLGLIDIFGSSAVGVQPSVPTSLSTTDQLAIFGRAVSIVDVNRDTYDDLVVGIPGLGANGGMEVYK